MLGGLVKILPLLIELVVKSDGPVGAILTKKYDAPYNCKQIEDASEIFFLWVIFSRMHHRKSVLLCGSFIVSILYFFYCNGLLSVILHYILYFIHKGI